MKSTPGDRTDDRVPLALMPVPWFPPPGAADRARNRLAVEAHLSVVAALCDRALAAARDGGHESSERRAFAEQRVIDARAAVAALARPDDPVSRLKAELRLNHLATKILLLVAAGELRPEIARQYASLVREAQQRMSGEALIWELLQYERGITRHDVAVELAIHSPLVELGLVRARRCDGPVLDLAADPVVIARLRDRVDPGAVLLDTDICALEEMVLPDGFADHLLSTLSRPSVTGALRLAVVGSEGSGRRTLLAALAAKANRPLGVIDVTELPQQSPAFAELLRVEAQRAYLCGWLPCLTGFENLRSEERATEIRTSLRKLPIPVALRLTPETEPPLDPGYLRVDLRRKRPPEVS